MQRAPALFVGHGSPMNAIENNSYSRRWEQIGTEIAAPSAILSVSAHWYTPGTRVTDNPAPETIYDMYGFPKELYQVTYPAPGAPELSHTAIKLIGNVQIDNTWGFDHGTWSVLRRIFPKAEIPVFQLSVDKNATPQTHFKIGQALAALREQGVMIFGSGNVVHNLRRVNWDLDDGYPWGNEFDAYIKDCVEQRNFEGVINYKSMGDSATLSVPTLDHYAPLLYVLGASHPEDSLTVFNDSLALGSLSMTSYLFK